MTDELKEQTDPRDILREAAMRGEGHESVTLTWGEAARVDAELDRLRAENDAVRVALASFACSCTGRCAHMEWLPADNGMCPYRRAAMFDGATTGHEGSGDDR